MGTAILQKIVFSLDQYVDSTFTQHSSNVVAVVSALTNAKRIEFVQN